MIGDRIAALGGFPEAKAFALAHCVLAHHGADGLPGRRYASVEAVALQRLNAVDAAVKGALEHGLGLDQRAGLLLPRLIRAAAPAPARAEAVAACRHACKQDEDRCDQSDDRRQAQSHADPVDKRGDDDRNQDSNHSSPP
jgi:hypothetical protein